MITDPRYNDPNYILNKVGKTENKSTTYAIDDKQVTGPKYFYPFCDPSCLDDNLQMIPGANYLFEDGRCYKAINSCNKYVCLDPLVTDSSSDISVKGNFASCTKSFETRVKGTRARFIRIEKGTSMFPVSINTIEAYDIFGTYIQPIIGRAYPLDGENYGINLLSKSPDKIAKTTNVEGAYVQIDLGSDYTIYMVAIVNVVPLSNIVGNNLVMIRNDKTVSMSYPINYVYDIYYITTNYDPKYVPDPEEVISFEPYSYPSCIDEGCMVDNTIYPGYKYIFDKPIPKKDEDLLIPNDNRCFNTLSKCEHRCLDRVINGDFSDEIIDEYFTSCENSINTLRVRIPAKYIRLERTTNVDVVELSELEAYDGATKYTFDEVKTFPYDINNPPKNLIDNNYLTITKTLAQADARIQCKLHDDVSMLSLLYLSIPTSDSNLLIGTTLFIVNKYNIIVHSFTFTADNITKLVQVTKYPNINTYKLYINGTGTYINTVKDMRDIYSYPSCIPKQCVIDSAQIKDAIYNLPDGRCAKATTNCLESNCLAKLINNTLPFSDVNANFQSCSDTTDTRITPAYGRYVRIQREDSSLGFNLSEIYITGQTSELPIVAANSYPVLVSSGTPLSAKLAYDRNPNTNASTKTSNTLQNPFMQFDLGANKMITNIKLQSNDTTINGTKIYILNDKNEIVFSGSISNITPGSPIVITTGAMSGSASLTTMSTTSIYAYPDCVIEGCTLDGHFIKDQIYENAANNTCFIAKSEDPVCLSKMGNLYGSEMDKCFSPCGITDTRYGPSNGRFIRVRNESGTTMSISEIAAYNADNVAYSILTAFSKGVTNITNRSDNIINKTVATTVSGPDSYVQIDLGSNNELYNVKISGTITSGVVEVINENGMVVSSNNITGPGTYSIRQNIIPVAATPGLEETFDYPACNMSASYKDCVDINGRPKPFFKYNTTSGSCGIAKITCSGCLQKLSDGTLTQAEADLDFKSCTTGETRYPTLRGRYIRIQSNGAAFSIQKLLAYSNNSLDSVPITVSDTFSYPSTTGSTSLTSGVSTTVVLARIDTINPFVQLDLGSDQLIQRIEIQNAPNDNSLSSTTLYIVNDAGTTLFQKSLTSFTSPITVSAVPGTYTPIQLSNSFTYPSCKVNSCLTNNHQVLNQQYLIGDRCFKASNTKDDSMCLSKATTLYGADMDACFITCGSDDTRYPTLTGRYIRLTRTIETEMQISEIKATKTDGTLISIYSTYAKGCTDVTHRSDKLNIPNNYVSVRGTNSYIQAMFEVDNTIKSIIIAVPNGKTFNDLIGSTLQVLSSNGNIVNELQITTALTPLSDTSKTFFVKANMDGTKSLVTSAEYTYPACSTSATDFECITDTGLSKPNFKYNISQNRCAIALNKCNTTNCMEKLDKNLLSNAEMDVNFKSCDPTRFTQYSSISGRYIRIERSSSSDAGFVVKGIEAYNGTSKLNATHTRSFPLVGTNYSQYMKDSTDVSPSTTVGPTTADASGTMVKPFVQLDYSSDIVIQKVVVTTDTDSSMDGTVLKIINSSGQTVYQENIALTGGVNTYTFNVVNMSNPNMTSSNLVNTFSYNSCVNQGCVDENMQIENQIYTLSDNRCFKSKGYFPVSQCLGTINTLTGAAMETCFDTCTPNMDTRFPPLVARIIRLRQGSGKNSEIKLFKLVAIGKRDDGTTGELPIVTKHCKPVINNQFRSDNLNTGRTDPAGATGSGAYIQIDLGKNYTIYSVKINWYNSIVGTELIGIYYTYSNDPIANTGLVKYSISLSDALFGTSSEKVLLTGLNVLSNQNANVMETYIYPATKTTLDGGLDENSKPKVPFIYNLDNGLSVIAKTNCVTNDCLSFVYNNTMTLTDMNTYFNSTKYYYDTRFPSPSGRYIWIQRTDSTKNGFSFQYVGASNNNRTDDYPVVSTLAYPRIGQYNTTNIVATPNLGEPGKPFVQFDLGSTVLIQSLNIKTTDLSLKGTTVYIIDANGVTVYQKSLDDITTENYILETLKYPEVTKNNVTMTYTFLYDSCKSLGCTSLDNKQYDNQMYKLTDGRCFKAIGNQPTATCLDNISNLAGADMDKCFNTCSTTGVETRYPALVARYIRIRQTATRTSDIKLFKLTATGVKDDGTTGEFPIITKHCKPVISNQFRSDNLNAARTDPAGATGPGAYVQIDLGKDTRIDSVKINWINSINGTELVIIRQDGAVKHLTSLNTTTYNISGEIVIPTTLNTVTTEKVTIAETYIYPATKTTLDGGLDENSKPKVPFIYNLDNGLSVIAKTNCVTNDCLSFVYNNTMTLTDMNTYFNSTSTTFDSRFPNPSVRYIKIQRSDGTRNGFTFSSITFTGDLNITSLHTLVYPQVASPFTTSTITGTPNTDEVGYPFVQFDFGVAKRVQFVNITTTDTSLNGTTIHGIDINGSIIVQKSLAGLTVGVNNIELLKIYGAPITTVPLFYKFPINTCKSLGCTPDNSHYENQMYVASDLRCFKGIGYRLTTDCLDKIDTLDKTNMPLCFDTCSSGVETRFPALIGRFVRIRQSGGTSTIKLFKLIANNSSGAATVVTKHCKPIISNQFRSDNLNAGRADPAGATGLNAYIQIDLGRDTRIDTITIKQSGSISGTELIVITEKGNVRHSTMLTSAMFTADEITIPVALNLPTSTDIVTIMETYTYPATKLIYDGGLDETGKPKLLYRYNFDNGLSVISILGCQSITCLEDVYTNKMSMTDMNTYFMSTDPNSDTRFPNPVGQYIYIKRTDGTKNGFNITSVEIKSATDTWVPVRSLVFPLNSGLSTNSITWTLTANEPDSPFIILDLGAEKTIKTVKITTPDSILNGTTLYIIKADKTTVFSKALTTIASGSNTIEALKIPGATLDTVSMYYKFKYDGCKTQGCINSDNTQYDGQMYEMSDLRCYKAIGNQSIISCLDKVKTPGTLFGSNMNNCFSSCSTTYDSRYLSSFGRFIRLSRVGGTGNNIRLSSMSAYKPGVTATDMPILLTPLNGHSKNPVDANSYGYNLIDSNLSTVAACLPSGYLQLDLGSNMYIKYVALTSPTAASTDLIGTKLQVIRDDGALLHDVTLTSTSNDYTTPIVIINTEENLDGTPGTMNMMEEFNWDCTTADCVGPTGKVKPKFKYNITDGRCLIAKNSGVDNIIPQVINYSLSTADVLANFDSCNANYLTQFTSVIGRFIRIRRINNTTGPINIANVIIRDNANNIISTPGLKTYAKPLKTTAPNTYSYGRYMVDTDLTSSTITDTVSGTPLDPTLDSGYVQIDLGADKAISSIEIYHNGDATAAATLNNTELIVAATDFTVVFKQPIATTTIETQRTIRIQKLPVVLSGYTFTNSEIFAYPGCVGCIDESNNVYKDFRYNVSGNRCFMAKTDGITSAILDKSVAKDTSININTYFASCSTTNETRFTPAVGRYIRIERTDNSVIQLSRFEAHTTAKAFVTPVDIHIKPALSSMLSNYQLLMAANANTDIRTDVNTDGSTIVYVQLDLGVDTSIVEIIINQASVDAAAASLNGGNLYLIKQDGTITYQLPLNSTTLTTSSFTVY